MAVTIYWYGKTLVNLLGGETAGESKGCNFLSNDIKIALIADTYTPDQDTHESWADVSSYEASGAGYDTGGLSLASKTLTYDSGTNECRLDATDPEWNPVTITARYAVVYNNTPATVSDKILLGFIDFESNKIADNGSFKITLNADGLLKGTVS